MTFGEVGDSVHDDRAFPCELDLIPVGVELPGGQPTTGRQPAQCIGQWEAYVGYIVKAHAPTCGGGNGQVPGGAGQSPQGNPGRVNQGPEKPCRRALGAALFSVKEQDRKRIIRLEGSDDP